VTASPRITVLGIGNPLKKDEGVGVRVAEELLACYEFPEGVEVLDIGTMGMTVLHLFDECDFMVVADAVDGTGHEPGTVVLMSPEDVAPNQVMHSLHDMRFADVLRMAQLVGYEVRAIVVGVQIADMWGDAEIGLTPAVQAAIPQAVEAVLGLLAEQGVTPTPRPVRLEQDAALRSLTPRPVNPGGNDSTGAATPGRTGR